MSINSIIHKCSLVTFQQVIMPSTGYQILHYIFSGLAIVLNGVLLASMYKERKKIFVTRIAYLVANLAFADFLNGVFSILLQQPIKEIEFEFDSRHLITMPLQWSVFCASFLTLFLMAAERLVVVTLPMVWSSVLTIPRTALCILCVWLFSAAGGFAIRYKRYYAKFVICILVEFCAVSFIATHIYILWILRRREKRHILKEDPANEKLCTARTPNENIVHRKVTIVVTILLLVFIVTSVPYLVCVQMFMIQNTIDDTLSSRINVEVFDVVFLYAEAFSFVNFFSNPIIYAWRLRMYRKAFYSLLGRSTS